MKLYLREVSRSEVRKRLEIFRLKDLKYFLGRKRLSLIFENKSGLLDWLVMKPKLAEELMMVLYLREGIIKKQVVDGCRKHGVFVGTRDSREFMALKLWLRDRKALEDLHLKSRVENNIKWARFLLKPDARVAKKKVTSLRGGLESGARRLDARVWNVIEDAGKVMVLVMHKGRGVFRKDVKKVRYGLSASELLLVSDYREVLIDSSTEGAKAMVGVWSEVVTGKKDCYALEDVGAEIRTRLRRASLGEGFYGQIVRLKGKSDFYGVRSYDIRGRNLERLLPLLGSRFPAENVEIVEWLQGGRRRGYDLKGRKYLYVVG